LNGCDLQVFLPASIAAKVQRIDIVANSNFGFQRRLRLFSKPVSKADWIEVDIDVKNNFEEKGKSAKMRTLVPRDSPRFWSIELDNVKWELHESLLPEILRVQYQ